MSISKKHFEAIASALHSVLPTTANESVMKQRIAQTLAYRLAGFNPAFNAQRFVDACLRDTDLANLNAIKALEN